MKHIALSRFWIPLLRTAGAAALGVSLFGGMAAPAPALAAAPTTDYYQVAVGAAAGATIGTAGDTATGGTSCTLRDALGIVKASITSGTVSGCTVTTMGLPSSNTYVIRLPKGAYTYTLDSLKGELTITNNNVYIVGSSPTASIIQAAAAAGSASYRVFHLATVGTISLEKLTIRNGVCNGSCAGAYDSGGGGMLITAGTLALNTVYFNANQAGASGGGAILLTDAAANIVKSRFTGNQAAYGGAISILASSSSNVTVDGSTFVDNFATVGGGGIYTYTDSSPRITLNIIHGSKITRTSGGPATAAVNGGGLSIGGGNVVMDGSSIAGLTAATGGGAYVSNGASLTLQAKSLISGNTATNGGGVYLDSTGLGATLAIDGSTVSKNTAADSGGGVYMTASSDSLYMRNAGLVTANRAGAYGGGIANMGGAVTIGGKSQVSKNTVTGSYDGGGVYSADGSTTVINEGSAITGNSALIGDGGGLYGSGFHLDGVTISKNQATRGGGISGQFDAYNTTITGNTSTSYGGGINVTGASSLSSSTVSANVAKGSFGGGGGFGGNASLVVTNSTFSGNKAPMGSGGGFHQYSTGAVYFNNSTFSGNLAGAVGGGLQSSGSTVMGLYSMTFTRNKAAVSGGGLAGNAIYTDSIISGNSAPTDADCDSVAISAGYNLVGASCDTNGTTDISGGLANLGPLTGNGGPTRTHALKTGSQAIDAGPASCMGNNGSAPTILDTDQRGYLRVWGSSCDMGAFELQPKPPSLASPKAGAVVSTLKFSWKNDPATVDETFQITIDEQCTAVSFPHVFNPPGKSITVASLPGYGNYYWCIQANGTGSAPLALGEVRPFEYTFTLKPVANGYARQGNIKFSWKKLLDPSNGLPALSYDLIVSSNEFCPSGDVASLTGLTKTSATASVSPGLRYWKVIANFPGPTTASSSCRALNVTY